MALLAIAARFERATLIRLTPALGLLTICGLSGHAGLAAPTMVALQIAIVVAITVHSWSQLPQVACDWIWAHLNTVGRVASRASHGLLRGPR
jgi:hypothetical protein